MELINLGSIVDTLKINATFNSLAFEKNEEYQDKQIEDEIKAFNLIVEDLIKLKDKAQRIKSHDAQKRFEKTILNGVEFRVMATSSASYSVILQNGDISIFLRKFSKLVKNPVIKVEFRAEFLAHYGYVKAVDSVQRLIKYEFIQNPVWRIKEIHLATDIQGFEFTPLDFYRIKTLSRNRTVFMEDEKNSHFSGQRFTGMTFGKGDLMLRIYNKTAEISKNKKKGFIEVLKWEHNPNFNPDLKVWRIEGQIRRDKLKELAFADTFTNDEGEEIKININLDSLDSVLDNIPSIWKLFINRFMHKNLLDSQIHEQMQGYKRLKDGSIKILLPDTFKKRFQKATTSRIWNLISTFNGYQGYELSKFEDIKKPEVQYVENAYKALISTFTKLKRGNFSTSDLVEVIHNANDKFFNKKGFSILDNARINALDYLSSAKYYYTKFNCTFDGFDEFESELYKNLTAIIQPTEKLEKKLNQYKKENFESVTINI